VSELEGDLRATAEDIAADATKLKEIEETKADLDPADPLTQKLSEESEQIARRIVPKTVAEREITDAIGKGESTSG
jgi:hypothetical protein